ncbi:MAG TPA: PspC domain-containing protein [Actinomycetota bacterium]|nr:PspC domain-containing protein [Actinomycetota bacterium]
MPVPSGKPLRRSKRHRIIAGVCGGFAEWRGWRPTTVRIVFLIATLAIPGIFVYLVLWAILPEEP